jgi:single-stranded-DNA-specific exonuclease
MQNHEWQIKTSSLQQRSKIIPTLLKNRNLNSKLEIDNFFNPTLENFFNLKLSGTEKAIERINQAMSNNEKIVIYSDYDADGISGTAILWETLSELGADVLPYVPDRMTEGYGLNTKAIENLKSEGVGLIITVDHGISADKEIDFANSIGVDVIITDHHVVPKKLPKAYTIVHTTELAGCGVAAKLAYEFAKTKNCKELAIDKLELAAIGTIADLVPLLKYNRSLTKTGIEKLNFTTRPGLLALYAQAKLTSGQIGNWEISHIIAPRINAAGRIQNAISSLRLLCTKNKTQAQELVKSISQTNSKRQDLTIQAVAHARSLYTNNLPIGILSHSDWHEGVIGLVASKMVEEFYRPMIIISQKNAISKGSARSVNGFNIVEAIRHCSDILESVGGHPMAAGFSIKTENISIFSQKMIDYTYRNLNQDNLEKTIEIDCQIDISDIDWQLFAELEKFKPCGTGNPEPVFLSKKVLVNDLRHVGIDNKHLKLQLANHQAIGFNFGERIAQIRPGDQIDLVYKIEKDNWNGANKIQLKIVDFKNN